MNILEKMSENSNVTLAELSKLLGLGRTTITDNVSKLQKMGILKRVGSDKTGYWEVVNHDEA